MWARFLHFDHPVPSRDDKARLANYTRRNIKQVSKHVTCHTSLCPMLSHCVNSQAVLHTGHKNARLSASLGRSVLLMMQVTDWFTNYRARRWRGEVQEAMKLNMSHSQRASDEDYDPE